MKILVLVVILGLASMAFAADDKDAASKADAAMSKRSEAVKKEFGDDHVLHGYFMTIDKLLTPEMKHKLDEQFDKSFHADYELMKAAVLKLSENYVKEMKDFSQMVNKCQTLPYDEKWEKHLESKLSADYLKDQKTNLIRAVSHLYFKVTEKCGGAENRKFIDADADLKRMMKTFATQSLKALDEMVGPNANVDIIAQTKDYLNDLSKLSDGMLRDILWTPGSVLMDEAYAAIPAKLKTAVEAEPAFKKPFDVRAAVKTINQ